MGQTTSDDVNATATNTSSAVHALDALLTTFREDARSNRDLGDRFERLIVSYLETDPIQAERFDKVWMWSEWPDRGNMPDTGADLVARERATGDLCAIQCKFYLPEHSLAKGDIDSFLAILGKPTSLETKTFRLKAGRSGRVFTGPLRSKPCTLTGVSMRWSIRCPVCSRRPRTKTLYFQLRVPARRELRCARAQPDGALRRLQDDLWPPQHGAEGS